MRRLDLAAYELYRDYSVWPIDFAMSASFEVPSARLEPLLPENTHLVEPRPGTGLLNLTVFSFPADTYGLTASCVEFVVSVHVIPDLSRAHTLPRLSLFTLQLGASTREFINDPYAVDRYPVYPEPLAVHIDRDRIAVAVDDEAGRPIARLAAAEGVRPVYEDDEFYVQASACTNGELVMAGNLFRLRRTENQQRLGTAGTPIPHPFYAGLDLQGITAQQCHMQMWSEPDTLGSESHFFLKSVRQL